MHWREPVDIAHAHIPDVGLVRSEDNRSDGRCFIDADCAVQGVLRTYFGWTKIWSGGVGGFELYGGGFGIGCDWEFARGVRWVGGVGKERGESDAAEAVLVEERK